MKWLTIKQTGRSSDTQMIADLNENKCELCGFHFEFTPVYSVDYNSNNRSWGVSLALDITKSLFRRICQRFIFILLTLLWAVFAPLVVGAAVVRMALYWNELPPFSGTVPIYYVMGMFSLVIGVVILVILSRARDFPQLPRDIRSTAIIIILAAVSGSAITILPYITGRSFRNLLSHMCLRREFFCALIQEDPHDLSPLSQHLSNISLGLLVLISGGIGGVLIRRLYRAGAASLFSSLYAFTFSLIRTFAYLIVPLSVGFFGSQTILSQESQLALSSKLSVFGSLIIHLSIGATLILPLVLLERFTFSHFVSRRLREQITNPSCRVAHVIFNGRTYRDFASRIDVICRESLIRIFVHFVFLFIAILPAKKTLQFFNLLPLVTEQSAPATSSLALPIELFYAHILVPLALNVPPIPRWIKRKINTFCRNVRYADLLQPPLSFPLVILWLSIRIISIFSLTLLIVSVPTIVARLTFGTDDMVSVLIGSLIVAGIFNISIRLVSSLQERPAPNRPRTESDAVEVEPPQTTSLNFKYLFFRATKQITLVFAVSVVLPIFVGIAFHSVIVAPIRHMVSDLNLRDSEPLASDQRSIWSHMAPIWIVGLMLLKILIALVSVGGNNGIGFVPFRNRLEAITRAYESHGPISDQLVSAVAHAAWLISKPMIFHVFFPEFLGILAMSTKLVSPVFRIFIVDIYLISRLTKGVIVPAIRSAIVAEHRAIMNKKFLVRTELRNFFVNDALIGEEGIPGTPLPSIQINTPLVNT